MFSQRPKPSQFHKFHQIISGMTIRMASTQHKKSRSKNGTAQLLAKQSFLPHRQLKRKRFGASCGLYTVNTGSQFSLHVVFS